LRIAASASLTLFGIAIHTAQAKDPGLLTLTPDHFRQTAALTSDPVSGTTTISTAPGFVEHTGLMRTVWHDEYLQAVIDGKTGRRTYQITAFEIYNGSPRWYETATYSSPNGPRTVKTTVLEKKAEFCATGACTYTERVAFPIEEETLRQAAGNAASSPSLWRFELVAKAAPNYIGALSTAEIAGLLAKVDEAANTVSAPKANAEATLQKDLGIEGISVAATSEPPGRGGILIAGVKSGSIAQKAGVIIGDILYEFDGHPVMNPTDLQSVVAAAAANAKIPLRIYRGLGTMTVNAQF
jgi:hypothetical protein